MHYFEENLQQIRFSRCIGIALLTVLAACEPAVNAEDKPRSDSPATVESRHCGGDGYLSAQLFGSIDHTIDWNAREVDCESMLRPRGEGVRLRFTGMAADQEVSIIIAVPDLERGIDGHELPAVVTLAVEGSGRFFSTASLDTCFTDIDAGSDGDPTPEQYDVRGTLFCVSALGEVNGEAAVSIPELQFRSRVDWSDQ